MWTRTRGRGLDSVEIGCSGREPSAPRVAPQRSLAENDFERPSWTAHGLMALGAAYIAHLTFPYAEHASSVLLGMSIRVPVIVPALVVGLAVFRHMRSRTP